MSIVSEYRNEHHPNRHRGEYKQPVMTLMSDPVTFAGLSLIPLTILQWYAVASYALYWHRLPKRSPWRFIAWLIVATFVIGGFFVELWGYEYLTRAIAKGWFLTLICIQTVSSALILIGIGYQQDLAENLPRDMGNAPKTFLHRVPKERLPLFAGIAALGVGLYCLAVSQIPREWLDGQRILFMVLTGGALALILRVAGYYASKGGMPPDRR